MARKAWSVLTTDQSCEKGRLRQPHLITHNRFCGYLAFPHFYLYNAFNGLEPSYYNLL